MEALADTNLCMDLCGQTYKIRLPSTAVYMYLQPESETAFVLHLKTPRMLKAEVSSRLLLMVLLQEKNFAEYRVSLHTEQVSSLSLVRISQRCAG